MPVPPSPPPAIAVTGVILAGGLGRRMGGVDKGLQPYQGKALVSHVIERLAPQVDHLLINANRSEREYAAFGYPLIADRITGFAGPLAGLHAALAAADTPYVVTVPCDSPGLPADLVERLRHDLLAGHAKLAMAKADGRLHPVFCLCHRSLLAPLEAYLQDGGRKVATWCAAMNAIEVDFSDQREAFGNFNTLADLAKT